MKKINPKTGVIRGASSIAYSLDLPPRWLDPESTAFLEALSEKYLSYLQKESEHLCDFVRFGGLSFEEGDNTLTLHVALCPFSERSFCPVALLSFNESGALQSIRKEKRSRRKSS